MGAEVYPGQSTRPRGTSFASSGNPQKSDLDTRILAQAQGKLRFRVAQDGSFVLVGLNAETFMSPLQPMPPQVMDPKYGAIGRRWDYPVGINTNYTPRGNQVVSFADCRALAKNYDLLRTVIETRKDQLCALDWKLAYKDKEKDRDGRISKLEALFNRPDRRVPYITWMRSLLEELFVTDALTIYPVFTNGGDFFAFEQIDGSLIKPVIDAEGRQPDPPDPAYQQILKGLPAVDYTLDELVYWPQNQSVHSLYGFSRVEQIIVSVNIALRRQIFQLDYYRQGSIPDAMISVPDSWTPDQILQIQDFWDSQFMNQDGANTAERRKLKFMPGGGSITFAKDAVLKDEYDEWLARIMCFAFSISPQPFIKQMNRGTGETQKEMSAEEGLLPLKKWWKALKDYLLSKYLAADDVEFMWDEDEEVDPKVKSDIDVQESEAGIRDIDEIRADRGLPPRTPEQIAAHAPVAVQLGPDGKPLPGPTGATGPNAPRGTTGAAPKPAPKGNPQEKLAKAAPRERSAIQIQRQRLTRAVKRQLRAMAGEVQKTVAPLIGTDGMTAGKMLDAIDLKGQYKDFAQAVQDPLKRAAADSVVNSTKALKKDADPIGVGITEGFVNDYADAYAQERGAEMVGMRWVDGELVENPDAVWQITDETRTGIVGLLDRTINEGWSVDQFATALTDAYAFSAKRAETIARTETRLADSKGNLAGWKRSGVVAQKVWLPSNDGCCDVCQANADQGAIDIDDDFDSGDDSTPGHPNCECVIAPVVGDEENDSEE